MTGVGYNYENFAKYIKLKHSLGIFQHSIQYHNFQRLGILKNKTNASLLDEIELATLLS